MKITTKTRYGLRALVYIAKNNIEPNQLTSIKEISTAEKISIQYLEQILFRLKNAGIIVSKKGPHGGYKLARDAKKIKIDEIFHILETNVKVAICDKKTKKCTKKSCSASYLWDKLNTAIEKILSETNLYELSQKE